MEKFRNLIGIILFLSGIGICFYPDISTWLLERQTENMIQEFEERTEIQYTKNKEEKTAASMIKEEDTLYQECLTYNRSICEEGQSGLKDAWSCEQSPPELASSEDGVFGYVDIPAMDTTLALYLGAFERNLIKGAAVMGQTSLPIGGEDTNCVIAGHRGYYGSPYFREIEQLKVGDVVRIRNPWEILTYRVCFIDIIQPYDIDAVKIQKGRDMVTLMTCHPYAANTIDKMRYVVYCERDESADEEVTVSGADGAGSAGQNGAIEASNGKLYKSSTEDIRMEYLLRRGCAVLLMLMAIMMAARLWRWRTKSS